MTLSNGDRPLESFRDEYALEAYLLVVAGRKRLGRALEIVLADDAATPSDGEQRRSRPRRK